MRTKESADAADHFAAAGQGNARTEEPDDSSATFPLAIANLQLDSSSPLPIHEQICQGVRSAISSQELPPGTLLPTSRELAQHLGVARNTVVFAYTRLVGEGLCVSNTRRGTRVAADFPARASFAKNSVNEPVPAVASLRTAYLTRNALETIVDRTAGGAPFALSASDPSLYPRTKLGRRVAGKFLGAPAIGAAGPAGAGESGRFQTSMAGYLRSARGVVCMPAQIIAVAGLECALSLTARVLLDPGDHVQVQDPEMDIVHSAFSAARAQILQIPSDSRGADPSRMAGPPARLICVSPSVSFPYGVQMPAERRQALLNAARAQNAVVFENDTYSELRYSGARLNSMQGMDADGRVIYYGGFVETLGNSVNVAYLVVPLSLVEVFTEVSRRNSNAPPPQLLDAVAEFVEEHEYAVHARNVRSFFAKRMETAKQACKAHLPQFAISEPHGGLFLAIHCEDRFDIAAVCADAAAEGVPVRPLSRYYFFSSAAKHGVVFGFGAIPERSVRPAIQQLAAIFARHRQRSAERISA